MIGWVQCILHQKIILQSVFFFNRYQGGDQKYSDFQRVHCSPRGKWDSLSRNLKILFSLLRKILDLWYFCTEHHCTVMMNVHILSKPSSPKTSSFDMLVTFFHVDLFPPLCWLSKWRNSIILYKFCDVQDERPASYRTSKTTCIGWQWWRSIHKSLKTLLNLSKGEKAASSAAKKPFSFSTHHQTWQGMDTANKFYFIF